MPHRKLIARIVAEQRDELVRYAGNVSGDAPNAEDLVQEAWLRCDQAAEREPLAKPEHMLWRILRNVSIDRHRRLARERRIITSDEHEGHLVAMSDGQTSAEDWLIAREELVRIQVVLDGLDDRTRAAFEMHRFEGMKLREIADRMDISVTLAHTLVARSMKAIRAALEPDC